MPIITGHCSLDVIFSYIEEEKQLILMVALAVSFIILQVCEIG